MEQAGAREKDRPSSAALRRGEQAIAAVIPAYNEEKHIGDVARRTRQQLDHVLVVDDRSTDKTAEQARAAGAEVIVHPENRGRGESLKTGLRYWLDRELQFVIFMAADAKDSAE